MGVPVSSFNDFRKKLQDVKGKSIIFGFLLFDRRPSQKVINEFTQEQPPQIDELAKNAGIYFFFPFKNEGENFSNPSSRIAKAFNLGLSRLPGIVFFAPPDKSGKKNPVVYIPLKAKDFNDSQNYETIFIDLFELIRESIANNRTSTEVLESIKNELVTLRNRDRRRGFSQYIRKGGHMIITDMPKGVLKALSEGAGRAMADKAFG